MSSDLHARATELLFEALELPEPDREAFLDQACGGDSVLRAEVESLLAHHHEDFLDSPLAGQQLAEGILTTAAAGLPERVGPYRIVGVLGEGGMGVVYEAEQDSPRRTVALKVIRPLFLTDKARRRFELETEVLGRLQHPGIAQIYEAHLGQTGEGAVPFFAMERIEGLPLLRHADEVQLSIRERLELFIRICEAVHHAHQKGVIHRDLKPGNILVNASGQPKVLDFGIARATESDLQATTQYTDVGQLIGTLAYMSPEQADASPDLDLRSDVYTLGVILYELLAGQPPYEVRDKGMHEVVRVIREEEPTPLSRWNRVLRGDVETIVGKALAKDRERRYGSAQELAADLERHLRNEPISARPPSASYRMRKFTARNRGLVGGVLATFLVLVIGLVVSLRLYLKSEENARQAGENAQTAKRNAQEAESNAEKAQHNAKAADESTRQAQAKEREANEQRRIAENRADEVLRLADVHNVQLLRAEADTLWPAHPEKILALNDWLARAEKMTQNLPSHQAALSSLQAGTLAAAAALTPEQRAWWNETLNILVQGIEELCEEHNGVIADVRRRLDSAETLWQRSIGDFEDEWDHAITEVVLSEHYDGLEIEPQVGLVPIGPDPDSGLWEYWHVGSGTRPVRGEETGKLTITGDSGIVLVLLPGGTFTMGAQSDDPVGPNYDPQASSDESPLHEVTLSPFFLSKYEMTQGQWFRGMREQPSYYGTGNLGGDVYPVEQVSWNQCDQALSRYGLILPTEAQWEYGARAGTSTPWWCGSTAASIGESEAGNLFDQRTRDQIPNLTWGDHEPWEDSYALHAPVGNFAANPFGLCDVIGNVWEWCADPYGTYDQSARDVDGLRSVPVQEGPAYRGYRGGCFNFAAINARSACRSGSTSEFRDDDLGVRPARAIDKAITK